MGAAAEQLLQLEWDELQPLVFLGDPAVMLQGISAALHALADARHHTSSAPDAAARVHELRRLDAVLRYTEAALPVVLELPPEQLQSYAVPRLSELGMMEALGKAVVVLCRKYQVRTRVCCRAAAAIARPPMVALWGLCANRVWLGEAGH